MRAMVMGVTAAVVLAACGSSRSANNTATATPRTSRASNMVTAEELASHGSPDLGEALRSLRPAWFRTRPTSLTGGRVTSAPIMLYVDGHRSGTISNLSDIPVASIASVRFFSPSEAQGRFGMDNLSGAIEITTKR